jgi:peptidoglycan hydrolase-like protein with peptidoglycan-binding domain
MKLDTLSNLRRLGLTVAIASALAGCGATLEVKKKTVEQTNATREGPEQKPFRTITGFSGALRCMDNMMIDYGVRDVSMLVEEIADSTKKVNAGTRDMLITAVSDMTRRSRAIRLVAFGKDATNAISFLASAQRQSAYDVIPQFDIKGSVSQLDENVIRNQKDLGVGIQPFINLGISRDAASSILGLDLSVLQTEDMAVLPGVTSRNSVVILKQGKGFDADAAYHKFGLSFSMNLNKSEGQTQALRGLVELAVIELMGKLTRTPYWKCLGAEADTNEEIKLEVSDWYYGMASGRGEIVAYYQNQLRRRGFYVGPVDGEFNPAIDEALGNYRAALGMSNEAVIDEAFFRNFLSADHNKIRPPAQPAVFKTVAAPASLPAPATSEPLKLALSTTDNKTSFGKGEAINLVVKSSRDAFVYCYLQDERSRITRFFPNRFAKDAMVPAARPLSLPGTMRFALSMNERGTKETIACLATNRDVLKDLPPNVAGTDFEPLALGSLDQVRAAFAQTTGGAVALEIFHVQAK